MNMSILTKADDLTHPPANDDPYWTETVWFGANVPERRLGVNFFMLLRTNLGIMVPSLFVWGPGGEEIWSMPYQRTLWHGLMPKDHDATNFKLPSGFEVERVNWLDEYRVRFEDSDRIKLNLHFKSLSPPVPYGVKNGYGHLDQYGHVTGEIVLDGEHISVDCLDMRDRTWSPRRETSQTARIGYTYGASSQPRVSRSLRNGTTRSPTTGSCWAICSPRTAMLSSAGGRDLSIATMRGVRSA